MKVRPSLLPKLAVCGAYEPDPNAGPAAERGTRLDACFRAAIANEPWPHALADDEVAAVQWAVDTVRVLAGAEVVHSAEADCALAMCGMTGTADALTPNADLLFDLKTGEERNYREQMAAYALGCMERFFEETWTCYLLFCDLRRVVKHEFTRVEAGTIVLGVLAAAHDGVPNPCEYCDWCAKRFTCAKRLEGVAWWAGLDPAKIDWDLALSDPGRLSQFLDLCQLIAKDGGLRDMARERARAMLAAGTPVPGYGLRNKAGSQFVLPDDVGRWLGDLGHDLVLKAYGHLGAEKFRAIWAQRMPSRPFPEDVIQQGPGSQYVAQTPRAPRARRKEPAVIS
jgi:hypothetical protein